MSVDREAVPFLRRHSLSPEAIAYKTRRRPSVPIQMPDLSDHAAAAHWRAATNALWGEGDDPRVPHRREAIAGVRCLVAGSVPPSEPPARPGVPRPRAVLTPAGDAVSTEVAAAGQPAPATVVYVHGGGYVLGSAAVAIPITARLAASGLRAVSVDYRQPPEHPFPAALDDVLAVYRALAASGAPVALAGDSAGGALALSAAVVAAAEGVAPSAVALFSPLLDHVQAAQRSRGNSSQHAHTPQAETSLLVASYLGGADPADPRISPLRAELAGLPPLLIQAASAEPLADQAIELHSRAAAAGVAVTLDLWEHMWHTWHYHDLPEADQALTEAAAFLAATTPRMRT